MDGLKQLLKTKLSFDWIENSKQNNNTRIKNFQKSYIWSASSLPIYYEGKIVKSYESQKHVIAFWKKF